MPLAVNSTNGMRPVGMRCMEEASAHQLAGFCLQASAWRRRGAPACRVSCASKCVGRAAAHLVAGVCLQASAWARRRRTSLQGFACKPAYGGGGDAPACRVLLASQCVGTPACRVFLVSQRGKRFNHICGCRLFGTTTFVAAAIWSRPHLWLPPLQHNHICGCLTPTLL